MVRRWFFILSAVVLAVLAAACWFQPWAATALVLVLPLIAVGLWDSFQRTHTVLRNFPVIGHFRYLLEDLRPELHQYFIESNIDAYPLSREFRAVVYQRAKGELETQPFGTQRDVYGIGYEWAPHSVAPAPKLEEAPRIRIGTADCRQPYEASMLNVSAMSFGSLSGAACRALNIGAREGGFAHNTGEGGVSSHHLQGGDLIWQIGTGYFGCRDAEGRFCLERFERQAVEPAVKMIEVKLSQGAKPGHGGVLPGGKVTPEIAAARGVPVGKTIISPPGHSAFDSPRGLLEFLRQLREASGGKPVGFKLCIGRQSDFLAICKAMLETGIKPDFITVDGGEGGTGAAPLEFANSVGMPGRDGWLYVHNALVGTGLRDEIKIIASGKILTGFHMVRALALGADICTCARAMMLALGCIQALRCNTNHCPTGVATQNPALERGLHVGDKAARVTRFQRNTIDGFLELLSALGLNHPDDLRPHHIFRRIDDLRIRHFGELYDFLEPGQLLDSDRVPDTLSEVWNATRSDDWETFKEAGQHGGQTEREEQRG